MKRFACILILCFMIAGCFIPLSGCGEKAPVMGVFVAERGLPWKYSDKPFFPFVRLDPDNENLAYIVYSSGLTCTGYYTIEGDLLVLEEWNVPEWQKEKIYYFEILDRKTLKLADATVDPSIRFSSVHLEDTVRIGDVFCWTEDLAEEQIPEAEAYDSDDKKAFYEFTLALDALKQSLTGEEKTVILDGDSALAQILTGKN